MFKKTSTQTTDTAAIALPTIKSTVPSRHHVRSAVRKWARKVKAAADKHYVYDVSHDITRGLVSASHPSYDQVLGRVKKLLEESKLFDKDSICGDMRVSVTPGAKL